MFARKQNTQLNLGLTLIELLVVIWIMILISTMLIVNYNRQRGVRNLKIAQNELVTNIRRTHSAILSSRNSPASGLASKFYIVEVNTPATGTPPANTRYALQNIDANYNISAQTVSLPEGIIVSEISVSRGGSPIASPQCAQLMFAAPFGQLYTYFRTVDNNCGGTVISSSIVQSPAQLLNLTDSTTVITLRDTRSSATKTVTVYGVSGKVEASQ